MKKKSDVARQLILNKDEDISMLRERETHRQALWNEEKQTLELQIASLQKQLSEQVRIYNV